MCFCTCRLRRFGGAGAPLLLLRCLVVNTIDSESVSECIVSARVCVCVCGREEAGDVAVENKTEERRK